MSVCSCLLHAHYILHATNIYSQSNPCTLPAVILHSIKRGAQAKILICCMREAVQGCLFSIRVQDKCFNTAHAHHKSSLLSDWDASL